MLKSMTGFGKAEGETSLGKLNIEIRSINHRYCDINIKLPKRLTPIEQRIREVIKSQVSRGKIDVVFRFENTVNDKFQLKIDLSLAQQYYKALQLLKEKLGLKDEINLQLFVGFRDLISLTEDISDVEPYWEEIDPILRKTIEDMDRMKRREGEFLKNDILIRLNTIKKELEIIKNQFLSSIKAYQSRLRERVRNLIGSLDIEPFRFEQEVALLAERMDITEEIVRAESHLSNFYNLLEDGGSVGRKMDFLLQEIYREVNTISSKINNAEISNRVVEIKSELEKIREQVQNIE